MSPFTSTSFGTTAYLQSVGTTGLGVATNFQYAGSGEMTQMTTPLGGVLQWTYRGFTYGTGIAVREVQNRYMPMYAGAVWWFGHDDAGDAGRPFHSYTQAGDSTGSKVWAFGTSPAGNLAVPTWNAERSPGNDDYQARGFSWTLDAAGNIYCNATAKYLNPSAPPTGLTSPSWPSSTTTQALVRTATSCSSRCTISAPGRRPGRTTSRM
ncbi:MAG: hypothetical protein HYX26_09870 [Acidobacteriales bacterium]|nr:hypothetical protein [Terriglobales bacterium]